MVKGQIKIDEFAFVLLAGIVLIAVLMVFWTTPTEAPPTVDVSSKTVTVLTGGSTSFPITISGPITNVSISAYGTVANWLSFSSEYFDYINESQVVVVYVKAPSNVALGTYKGTIKVSSTGGSKDVQLTVNVQNITTVEFLKKQIALGDFSVSFSSGSRMLDSANNTEVVKGYFAESNLNLIGIIDEVELNDIVDANVRLVISDTNKLGNLIVELNEKEIYNHPASLGELIIPINVTQLTRSNAISIKAGNPGWMFWANTVYKIREASFSISFKGINTKEVLLNLTQQEVANFNHIKFNAVISSEQSPILRIKVNEQTVYLGKPPIFALDLWIDRDILGNPLVLNTGTNKIEFALESPGRTDFKSGMLTFNYLP
jgi:hypothetical protein